jgi:ABC-type branched-subunit amino acid transport system ATPase component
MVLLLFVPAVVFYFLQPVMLVSLTFGQKNGTAIAGATSSNYTAGATGVYAVIATNGFGCTSTSNAITVTVNNTQANITANGPTTFCVGDSVVLSANTGANLTYQWTQNNITINGATSATHSAKNRWSLPSKYY